MQSRCVITFEGLNVLPLINTLCSKNISILRLERQSKLCIVEVLYSQHKVVVDLLKEKCYNIKLVECKGWAKWKTFARSHILLMIMALLLVPILAITSQLCCKICIVGDYNKDVVQLALSNCGIKQGSILLGLNIDNLENQLCNKLDAAYVVVNKKGAVLYVNAIAQKHVDAPIDMNKSRNIYATASGQVVSVLCEQGTPCVNVGDVVQVGDTLILGKRIFSDGMQQDTYALGKVVLKVSCSYFAEFTGVQKQYVETGKTFQNVSVQLFANQYGASCPFENYSVTQSVTKLFPFDVAIYHNVYKELQVQYLNVSMEDCLQQLKESAYQNALNICNFAVSDTQFITSHNGVTAVLYGYVDIT